MSEGTETRAYLAFLGAVVIGGTNFVAVTFSNQELPPLYGATLRFGLATIVFFMIAILGSVPRPDRRALAGAALYGLLSFGAAYAFLYYALVGLAAGTAAVILAAVPLFTHPIAVLTGQEQLSMRGLFGGILALAGIVVLSLGSLGGEVQPSYVLAALGGTVVVAASSVVARGLRHVHPVNMNAYGMAAGTILLGATSMLFRESWFLPQSSQTWLAVLWLVLLGSVGLFQLFLYVIKRWTASATVYAVAAMPVVAVLLGALLLDQPVTPELLAGGALVLVAVYVGAISRPKPEARAPLFEDPASP